MKNTLILLTMLLMVFASCNTKKNTDQSNNNPENTTPLSSGKVSHQYRDAGCPTVIVVEKSGEESPMTLIPAQKLPEKFDKDGMQIKFNYRLLRMPNPAGCLSGLPAEITNVSK